MSRLKNVQIQTQGACNANCVFCPWIESWHHANYGVMDRELFSRILDMLLPWKESIEDGGKICPYLMQEPFVDKRIFELCEEIQSKFPKAVLELSTNGALLSRDKTERLISLLEGKPHEVWVSHHGIDKASHEEIMKINHERSTSHLINLIKEAKGRLNIRIRGSGSSRTGIGRHWFSRQEYFEYWYNLSKEHGFDLSWIDLDYFTYHDRAGTINREERGAGENNFGKVRDIGPGSPFHCSRLDEWLHVMWNGDIRLCCMDYHAEVKLPNLNDMTIEEYYRGKDFERVTAQVTGQIESPGDFICKRCTSPGG